MKIKTFDIGDTVVCDLCNMDYTSSMNEGGFIFVSKAVCPLCASRVEREARANGEEHFIKERARPHEPFRELVLRVRGGNNTVTITTFKLGEEGLTEGE